MGELPSVTRVNRRIILKNVEGGCEVTSDCPNCNKEFTRVVQIELVYPNIHALEVCPNCANEAVTIVGAKRYELSDESPIKEDRS